jgi:hypothetical protein
MDGMGAAQVGDAGFGEAEIPHLALPDQRPDGAGHHFDRHGRVDPVLIEEIDVVGPEAAQGARHRRPDILRAAVQPDPRLLPGLELKAKLGGEHDLVAPALEGPAEQFLVGVGTVDLRRVEKITAQLDGPVQGGDGLDFIRGAVGLAHAHAPEADGRHLQALAAEFAFAQ